MKRFLSLLAVGMAGALAACTAQPPAGTDTAATPPPPAEEQTAAAPASFKPAPEDPLVVLNTSKGPITIRVYKKEAPITGGNFLDLVQRGFYKDMVFHRVVPGFVIQTGDPTGTGAGGFTDPETGRERTIKLETKPELRHDAAGVVAMARSQDPNSASSQFYITLDKTPFLDDGYAVFGRVEKGLDVVKKIVQGDKFTGAKLAATEKKAEPAKK